MIFPRGVGGSIYYFSADMTGDLRGERGRMGKNGKNFGGIGGKD
jgi:hypothetical protein